MSSTKVADISGVTGNADDKATWVSNLWTKLNDQRAGKLSEWEEYRDYVFATDTTTTSNSALPWKNKTTLPKLCQLRDNLHSNYKSALFPNEDWVRWEGGTRDDSLKEKRAAIEAYIKNKARSSNFRTTMSTLLLDYIDYGNAFATVDYVTKYKTQEDGERITDYVGPVLSRISPLDIVFNPQAASFVDSYKIVRSLKTLGEIALMAQEQPESVALHEVLSRREKARTKGGYSKEDTRKARGYSMDGFGNYYDYLLSDYVEVLTFYGDYYDKYTNTLEQDRQITIVDRCSVIEDTLQRSWFGHSPIYHVGWRSRPDNLWSMGPLDNLVGMQYRIDHLENLKADAMDLAVHPMLKVIGEVEEFEYRPGGEILIDEGGDVQELGKNLNGVISADNAIAQLEAKMELYAGAPREAMGVRSPGEKTAFEVQRLENASGRIFQEKINNFEVELLEPILNAMLESARRHLDTADVAKSLDRTTGLSSFLSVTKEDITAQGLLRPIGARHFAAQAQLVQNLTGIFNSPLGQMIMPHTSSVELSKLLGDTLGVDRFGLFKPNIALSERAETQAMAQQLEEDQQVANKVM
jgi:hypothetical protein